MTLNTWSCEVTRQIKNISTTTMSMVIRLALMVTYIEELPLIKSHPSIAWSYEVTWKIKYVIYIHLHLTTIFNSSPEQHLGNGWELLLTVVTCCYIELRRLCDRAPRADSETYR